ncbi:hypothetical protein HYPSUDRAFT_209501 [Hypholoma sublateritium FD-334 SS-4]|uniref:Uncharacterized protein n=1 Tax=Hypholoma sublateritium (strain FD-334 SS-4) TaxID=945553 RepID=A0A0D2NA53_HYPSF|nr:hypothetical protein HYPSUDRAFT_209501 [Hypholoma sublateritium FD-334 SS-4]
MGYGPTFESWARPTPPPAPLFRRRAALRSVTSLRPVAHLLRLSIHLIAPSAIWRSSHAQCLLGAYSYAAGCLECLVVIFLKCVPGLRKRRQRQSPRAAKTTSTSPKGQNYVPPAEAGASLLVLATRA